MKYTPIILFAAVSIIGLLVMMHPLLTGFATEAPLRLIDKVKEPCYCAKGSNITQQIQEQQIVYESIVASAESAIARKEISEKTAIKVLNNYADGTCRKCLGE